MFKYQPFPAYLKKNKGTYLHQIPSIFRFCIPFLHQLLHLSQNWCSRCYHKMTTKSKDKDAIWPKYRQMHLLDYCEVLTWELSIVACLTRLGLVGYFCSAKAMTGIFKPNRLNPHFAPVSTHPCLNSKPPYPNNDERVTQGITCSQGEETSMGAEEIMYQCLEQRWFEPHVTGFCNRRGSFQSFRAPSFAGKNPEGAKEEPKRRIDARIFIQGILPEESRHTEKQRPKAGLSFEDSWIQEIFIFFLWRFYPLWKKKIAGWVS